jgi:arylsulfatase
MVVSWPKGIKPDPTMRSQFSHVVDIAPTIYEVLEIPHPKVVHGYEQMPIDGTSLAYTFRDGAAAGRKKEQFFDNNGSRGLYHDGWYACTFGPLIPWLNAQEGLADWDSAKDIWQLYKLDSDFSQSTEVAEDNNDFPIGAGIWLRLYPQDLHRTSYTSWSFSANTRRMPEFTAPGLGKVSNTVEIDLEVAEGASGVLYALGGSGGGLSLYMEDGHLVYLYNMMIIEQYTVRSARPIAPGKHTIEVITRIAGLGKPGTVTIAIDGDEVGVVSLKKTVPLGFSASETFDVGVDLGSTVSLDYMERRPFEFEGEILEVRVRQDP